MKQVLSMIWDHICEQLWLVRNSICHSNDSHATVGEMAQIAEKPVWYKRHQTAVLDYRHIFLAAFAVDDVTRWSRTTRQTKLKLLNNACKYYETEYKQKAQNQSTIHDWIHSYTVLRSARSIGSTA